MKYFKLLFIATWFPLSAACQTGRLGSISFLRSSNGFKNIVLGSDTRTIPGYKLVFLDNDNSPDADSCFKFEFRDNNLLKLDTDLSLDLVGIRTYKNKIVNIYLFFKRSDGFKMLDTFLKSYGQFTNKPGDYQEIYNWDTSLVSLSLRYELNTDLGIAIFTCKKLQKESRHPETVPDSTRDFQVLYSQY